MPIRMLILSALCAFLAVPPGRLSAADDPNPGQSELDSAIESKIAAESVNELGEVIRHCRRALELGLDESNTEFTKRLLASALIQRGQSYAELVFRSTEEGERPAQQLVAVYRMALEDLETALKNDAKQPEALYLIGRLQGIPGGDHKRAREVLDKSLELNKDDTFLRAKALTIRGLLENDPEKKLGYFNEAITLAPEAAEVRRARGALHAEQGRLAEARVDFEKVIELEATDTYGYEALAAVLAEDQKYDEALKLLTRAIELEPQEPLPYHQRARVQLLKGDAKAAIADLDHTLQLAPGHPGSLLLRASAYLQLGDREHAMADAEHILMIRGDYAPALRLRGLLFAESGKLEPALRDLRAACEAEPDDLELQLQLGMLELANKNATASIAHLTKVLTAAGDNWLAHQTRADAYLMLGKQAEALTDYEAALKLQPENSGILNNLAWLLATSPDEKLRNGRRAIELATVACRVTEYKQAHILSTLAAGFAETGDFNTAIEWSTKAVALGDDDNREALGKELQSYQEKKPWREVQTPPQPVENTAKRPSEDKSAAKPSSPDGKTAARDDASSDKP